MAEESKHLTAKLLFKSLQNLKRDDIKLYINHIKDIYLEKVTQEIDEYKGKCGLVILNDSKIINF